MNTILNSKKTFLIAMWLCCYVATLLTLPSHAHAWLEEDLKNSFKARQECEKDNETMYMECYVEKTAQESAFSGAKGILGMEYVEVTPTPAPGGNRLNQEKEIGYIRFNQKGVIPQINTIIAGMYANPPASFTYYAYDLLQNAGLVPKAYAQGIGFSGLSPIISLWKAFRNIAYMLIVVVLIVIGFMIMFRMKINPQTVISIQNALPRIAVTLLLITFSYAIVGLMIDLMYLAILLVASVLGKAAGWNLETIAKLQGQYTTGDLWTLLGVVFSGGGKALDDLFKALIPHQVIAAVLTSILGGVGPVIGGPWGFFFGALAPTGLFLLIFALSLLFIFIRLLVILLSSYIQVILAVIFGPIQIVFDALPGRTSFISWLTGLIGNLIVFPVTAAMLILGMILTAYNINPGAYVGGDPGSLWTPPLTLVPGGSATVAFIGLGIIMITPSIATKAKRMLQPKPGLPIGPGAIFAPFGVATQQTLGIASQFYYMHGFLEMINKLREGRQRPTRATPGEG